MFEDLRTDQVIIWCMRSRIKPEPELIECIKLKHYLDYLQEKGKVLFYSKIAQETWTTSRKQLIKNKATGIHPGVSDYVIIIKANKVLNGSRQVLFLEMKQAKGKLSKAQDIFLNLIHGSDTIGQVAYSYQEAKKWLQFIISEMN